MNSIFFTNKISTSLGLKPKQVSNTITLLENGATIPFISRYRKEQTDNLDEVQIENIAKENERLLTINKRKISILKSIEEQGKLTSELKKEINDSWNLVFIEDLYLPFKPRKQNKCDVAIENGLEPLAKIIMAQNNDNVEQIASRYINKNVKTKEDAIVGAGYIASQWISERIYIKERLRKLFWSSGQVHSKVVKTKIADAEKYKDYFEFSEPVKKIKSHRLLAVLRGSSEGYLRVKVEPLKADALHILNASVLKNSNNDILEDIIKDCYKRILKPSLEKEITKELKLKADIDAIDVFGKNLKQLLLQPPIGGLRTLAIDPGYKSGCKIVCLDANGDLLSNVTVYPNPPQKDIKLASKKISTLVEQYRIEAIAVGNGTASRETERFVKNIYFDRQVKVFIVNEAGASIYSASSVAREEFPQHDVTVRGSVSIGRRLMDPLAELVKIDPKSIGVGQYQHDVDQKLLQNNLDTVVVSCVNSVGIDLNTASKYLLTYVSGIGPKLAQNIIDYRTEHSAFTSRKELLKVPKLGGKAYEQCAGFLRVKNDSYPLDNSSVHPERYDIVKKMAKSVQTPLAELIGNVEKLDEIKIENFIDSEIGSATLTDIVAELKKPGRDPRKMAKVFEFEKSLRTIDDLRIGQEVPGIVNNVTNFGAFVDIGIKENGLIHISNLADGYVANPADVIGLHEHVMTEVISIDKDRKRIGLKRIEK